MLTIVPIIFGSIIKAIIRIVFAMTMRIEENFTERDGKFIKCVNALNQKATAIGRKKLLRNRGIMG